MSVDTFPRAERDPDVRWVTIRTAGPVPRLAVTFDPAEERRKRENRCFNRAASNRSKSEE